MAGPIISRRLATARVKSVAELAAAADVRTCLEWFAARKRWIDNKHLELCRIPAPTFQEERRAEWMVSELAALGCRVETDPAGNVIAFPRTTGRDKPAIALTAHLDTVLAPRKMDDVTVDGGGRFQGPGVSDNGAGLAALLAMAGVLHENPWFPDLRSQLVFLANVGEEGEGNLSGMRYLCRRSPLAKTIETFVVLDGPSVEPITNRAIASRRFEVTMKGPGGHSWGDYGTANPVQALSRAITLFADNCAAARKEPMARAGGRSSFNFGIFDGGASVNSIPALARTKVDLRSEDPAAIEVMAALLTTSVERALAIENGTSEKGVLTARIREIGFRPAGALPEDAAIIHFLRAVDAHLGIRSRLECASTDANIPLAIPREAIAIGTGGHGGGAHTPEEWYDPAGRELGLKRIFLLLCLLARAADSRRSVTET